MKFSLLLTIACVTGLSAAHAAPTFYSDFASFSGAAGPTDFESFEGAPSPNASPVAFDGGLFSCVENVSFPCPSFFGSVDLTQEAITQSNPSYQAHDGDVALGFTTDQTGRFTFDAPITSFGIYLGGAGNLFAGQSLVAAPISMSVVVNGVTDTPLSGYQNAAPTFLNNTLFFGVVDSAGFSTVSFTGASSGNDAVFLDSMYMSSAAAVPLPATLPILASALGLGAMIRRASSKRDARRHAA